MTEQQLKEDNVRLLEERSGFLAAQQRDAAELASLRGLLQDSVRSGSDHSELAKSMFAGTWMASGGSDLPSYDLESKDQPFSQFRADFDVYCVNLGVSDNMRKMLLQRSLKGLALQRFKELSQQGNDFREPKAMLDKLEEYFTVIEGGTKYSSSAFQQRKQKFGETVTSYFSDLVRLAKISWPDPKSPPPDQVMLERFIRGLLLPIRRVVVPKEPANLQAALELACKAQAQREFLMEDEPLAAAAHQTDVVEKVEALSKKLDKVVAFTSNVRTPAQDGKDEWPQPARHFPDYGKGVRNSGPRMAYNRQGDHRCWNCNRVGHYMASCRFPVGGRGQRNVGNYRPRFPRGHPRAPFSQNRPGGLASSAVATERATTNSSGGASGVGVSSGHLFLAVISVLCLITPGVDSQSPMLCHTGVRGQVFHLPSEFDCSVDLSSKKVMPQMVTYELARRNLLEYVSDGWLCRAVHSKAKLLRYFFGDETLKDFSDSPVLVSVEECMRMVYSGISPAGALLTTSSGLRKTNNKLNWRIPNWGFPECCKWWTWEATNYFVTPVTVYSHFNGTKFRCTGADVTMCPPYSRGSCQLGNEALIWNVRKAAECQFLPYRNLSGHTVERSWLSSDGQLALTTHVSRNVVDCGHTWQLSDQGIAFRRLNASSNAHPLKRSISSYGVKANYGTTLDVAKALRVRSKSQNSEVGSVGYVMTDVLSAELQALYEDIRGEMHQVYVHSLQQTCNHLKISAQLLKSAVMSHPTETLRQLWNTSYIVAESSSDTVEIWSCAAVRDIEFDTAFKSENDLKSCYFEIPIKMNVDNETIKGFLNPQNLVVQHFGTPHNCDRQRSVIFKMFQKTYQYDRLSLSVKQTHQSSNLDLSIYHGSIHDDFENLTAQRVFEPVVMYTWQELQSGVNLNALLHVAVVQKDILHSLGFITEASNTSNSVPTRLSLNSLLPAQLFLKGPFHIWVFLTCFCGNIVAILFVVKQLWLCVSRRWSPLVARIRNRRSSVDQREAQEAEGNTFLSQEPIEAVINRVSSSVADCETVNSVGMDKVLTVGVNIKGRMYSFLLDSGASLSMVTSRLVNKLRLDIDSGGMSEAMSITGHQLPIVGICSLSVQIGKFKRLHAFNVLQDCPLSVDGVLGLDILATLPPMTVEVARKRVCFGSEEVPVLGGENLEVPTCALQTTKIKPRSMVVVPCKLVLPVAPDTNLVFEQNPKTIPNYLCPRLLVEAADTVPVRVINVHEHPITIYENSTLGSVSLACEVQQASTNPNLVASTLPTTNPLESLSLEDSNITWDEEEKLRALLLKYKDLFAQSDTELPGTTVCEHNITVTNERPVRQKPYRVPQSQRQALDTKLDELLDAGIISPSSSPWASPVVIVSKPDGSIRPCIDYRKLNSVTVPDAYPLPRIDEAVEFLSGARYLSTLDLFSGYFQVPVAEESRKYTAFITSKGLFEFSRLPFGLRNAPATFQRLMSFVLSGLLFTSSIVYLDDVLIASKTFDEHLKHLEEVFKRLLQFGLRLKLKKCHWVRQSLPFLGFLVTPDGTAPNPENINKLLNYEPPKTVSQIRTFLGFCNFYRRFVPDYAKISRPLVNLTKRQNRFTWSVECEESFRTLIHKLTEAPVLHYPKFDRVFLLSVDASKYACGGVLSQVFEGREHPIAYFSRLFQKHEINYEVVEKELYAIILALRHWKHYVFGHQIWVYSDQQSLSWGIKQPNQTRLMKWVSQLSEFDVKIFYRPGARNKPADFFSRMNYGGPDDSVMVDTRPVVASICKLSIEPRHKFFYEEQRKDPVLSQIINVKLGAPLSSVPDELRSQVKKLSNLYDYSTHDEVLRNYSDSCGKVVVPEHLRSRILEECHDSVTGGHFKVDKTLAKVLNQFYWPTVREDVRNWIKSCQGCLTRARPTHPTKEPMQPITALAPWNSVVMDILGPLPVTNRGSKYILVIMDRFTRYPECAALRSISAKGVAKAFVNLVICRHGVPLDLQTDRGAQFTSDMFKEMSKLLGMKQKFSSSYHPESQGLVERFNSTLLQLLKAFVSKNQKDWCSYLDMVLFAYRTSVHASTNATPFELEHGRRARLPVYLLCPSGSDRDFQSHDEFVMDLHENISHSWQLATENARLASSRQKSQHDRRVVESPIQVGDQVYLKRPTPVAGLSPKLQPVYKGPYKVLAKQGVNALIVPVGQGKTQWVHLNDCKLAQERELWPAEVTPTSSPAVNDLPHDLNTDASTDSGDSTTDGSIEADHVEPAPAEADHVEFAPAESSRSSSPVSDTVVDNLTEPPRVYDLRPLPGRRVNH